MQQIEQTSHNNAVRVQCALCGTEQWQRLWTISRCEQCGHGYAHYVRPYEST